MVRRVFVAALMIGHLGLLGCGQQAPPAPPPPVGPPAVGATAPPTAGSVANKEQAADADRKAFAALEQMKVSIRYSYSGKGYDVGLQEKDLKEDGTIKPEIVKELKQLNTRVNLGLHEIPVSDAGLAQLKDIPAIQEIVLSKNKPVTDQGVQNLAGVPNLEELFLFSLKLTDKAFTGMKDMKQLKKLYVSGIPLGDGALANLKGTNELESLGIAEGDNLTAAGIAHLKGLPKLKRLTLESFGKETKLDAAALKEVGGLTGLEELRLGVIEPISFSARLPWITDAGVAHLGNLSNLKVLNLGSCAKVTDAGVAHLKNLKKLEELNIGYTTVTDKGLAHLKGLSNMKELNLNGLNITAKGLAQLMGMSKLEHLRLRECGDGVTDAAILQLKGLPQLKGLMCFDTAVTKEGAAALKKSLPDISVDLN